MPITYDTGSANTLDANSATVTTATITTTEDNELLISFFFGADNMTASLFTAATGPTNQSVATGGAHIPNLNFWGEVADNYTATGADTGNAFAHTVKVTAGATGTLQTTAGNSSRHGLIVGAFKLPEPPIINLILDNLTTSNTTESLTTSSTQPIYSASLILPRRFTRQPQGPVEIDWNNPLTDGLIVAFSAGSGFRNIAASTELVKVGTPNLSAVTQEGVAANFALASNDGLSVGTSSVYNPSEQTIFVIANPTSFGTSQGMMLFTRDSNTLGRSFDLDIYNFSSFGARYYVNGGGTLNTNELRENVAPTAKRYAVCATQIGSNAVLYLDGKSVASSSGFQSIASSTGDTQIGRRTYVGYTQSLNGTLPFAAMWERALSLDEVVAVNNNPWQLFRAKPRVLYFDASSGASFLPLTSITASNITTSSARLTVT